MRRLYSTWRLLGVACTLALLAACQTDSNVAGPAGAPPVPRATVSPGDAEIDDSHSDTFLGPRYAAYSCTTDDGPIVIDGTVDLSQVKGSGHVVMIGLIDRVLFTDPDLYSSPFDTWGSGAYAYFFPGAATTRIGPTDGYNGGEIVQTFVDAPPTSDDVYDFRLTVDGSGVVTVRYEGVDYTDTYGEVEDFIPPPFDPAGNDAYPHDEFEFGAVVGIDVTTGTPEFSYQLDLVSGCEPAGGFVTGGGWFDSPADAISPHTEPALVWDQGFETDAGGWFDSGNGWSGAVTRVASGHDGIVSSRGAFHTVMDGDVDGAPFSRFDGYRDTWTGSWTAEVDVYLDPAWPIGSGFDYTVAATGSDGNHQRDYIFHVGVHSDGRLLVNGSNNTDFGVNDFKLVNDGDGTPLQVTSAGWYTLQHVFRDQGGALAVDLNLIDSGGSTVFTTTRFNAADLIPAEVGGNRYGWFTFIDVPGGIAVDEHRLTFPVAATGKATFGFVARYKKGAQKPDGKAEFQFQTAGLNFHSTGYDWLVVNQGGENAQFKGDGTINGAGAYKFMLWAGDHDASDTFRIRITDAVTDEIVYDNGMNQPIGGGNIVIHDGKGKH